MLAIAARHGIQVLPPNKFESRSVHFPLRFLNCQYAYKEAVASEQWTTTKERKTLDADDSIDDQRRRLRAARM